MCKRQLAQIKRQGLLDQSNETLDAVRLDTVENSIEKGLPAKYGDNQSLYS